MISLGVRTVLLLSALVCMIWRPADAACPQSTCDCLGEAAGYRAVASDRLLAGTGLVRDTSPPFLIGSIIEGDLCAGRVDLAEPAADYTEIEGDLYVLAGPGSLAVRSRIIGPDGNNIVFVSGDLATGGGSVVGPVEADVIDTSGTHPGIASCQQAIGDMQAASQTLAALAPTQTVGPITVYDGSRVNLVAGPGVNVIAVEGRIGLKGSELRILLDPATDAVVVNVPNLFVGAGSAVFVQGGDETKVLLNLPGPGRAVQIKGDAFVAPVVLAPERVVRVGPRGEFAGGLARRVLFQGPFVSQVLDVCPPP